METKQVLAALAALAQDTRLRIFRLLVETGPSGLAAGEIAARLDVAAATLSFHLAQLEHAGLIASQRAGRSIIYAAGFDCMRDLIDYLTENCCQGDGAVCAVSDCTAPLQALGSKRTGKRA